MSVKKLLTLGPPSRQTEFSYSGTIETDVTLHQTGKPIVSAPLFAEGLRHFAGGRMYGRIIRPPEDSESGYNVNHSA